MFGRRRTCRPRRDSPCPRPVALEHSRILWLAERLGHLCGSPGRTWAVEAVQNAQHSGTAAFVTQLVVGRSPEQNSIDRAWALPYNFVMPLPPRKPGGPGWPPGPMRRPARAHPSEPEDQFEAFQASLLYCPQCRVATPTRERLLLVLPTGNLYEYLCQQCGTSTGSKTEQERGGMLRP